MKDTVLLALAVVGAYRLTLWVWSLVMWALGEGDRPWPWGGPR